MKIIITFFLFLPTFFTFAQTKVVTAVLIEEIPLKADVFIGFDKFDYRYSIRENVLFKIKDEESFEYKNVPLGKITKVDLLNPLKAIVFYERFNTAVTLDNQLNETLKINFSELKVPLVVTKIGMSSQNQLWVFDEITSQIFLYDTGNGTLKSIGTPISERIMFYTTDFNSFTWLDEKNNWYQTSVYGSVQKLNYSFDFDLILFANSDTIVYKKDEKIILFMVKNAEKIILEKFDKSFESLTFKNQILSIFTNQGISNYKITIP